MGKSNGSKKKQERAKRGGDGRTAKLSTQSTRAARKWAEQADPKLRHSPIQA